MARVRLSPAARADFRAYRAGLRHEAGGAVAEPYIDALVAWMFELREFPERGTPRADLGEGIRTRVFRRSVTIVYVAMHDHMTIFGVFGRGRRIDAAALTGRR